MMLQPYCVSIQWLIAVLLFSGTALPMPDSFSFEGAGIARADDDDDDDGGRFGASGGFDARPARPGARPPRARPAVKPPSARKIQPARATSPVRKPRPVVQQPSRKKPTFEPRDVLAIDADEALLDRVKSLGFTVGETVSLSALELRVTRLRTPAKMSPPQALDVLQRQIPNGNFTLNHIYRVDADPCRDGRCYGSALIGWERSERCGQGIRIGMTDTAADRNHAALNGRKIMVRTFAEDGRASAATHGTAVAALLVGAPGSDFPGLLPGAELHAADTFIGVGSQLRTNALLLGQGLNWLLEQRVSVVNVSLTGSDNRLLHEILKRLSQRKITVVAAAGNGGPAAPPAFPAAYPETIAVTAVDSLLRPYRMANRGDYVTVAAPGVRIWTPGPKGGQYRDGTSFAAPYVTAVVAQLRGRWTDSNLAELVKQLQSNARDLGATGKDPVFGWGLVRTSMHCE
ncbi:MAG: S8 family serine peptidase [Candidatus Competibacteraceae bacterium]|nr:S8 family serine peptidase [Candidatus Competibacteraceae bacterium]